MPTIDSPHNHQLSETSMISASDIAAQKQEFRQRLRARRAEQVPLPSHWAENYQKALQEIAIHAMDKLSLDHLTIAAFLPLESEPPILPALNYLQKRGHQILVPTVEPKRQLDWVHWTPDVEYIENSLGIREPRGERMGTVGFNAANVHLIPALAFETTGVRLGQGGGYYDRLLTSQVSNSPFTFGIAFSHEIVPELPQNNWDVQLSRVLTEEGIYTVPNE